MEKSDGQASPKGRDKDVAENPTLTRNLPGKPKVLVLGMSYPDLEAQLLAKGVPLDTFDTADIASVCRGNLLRDVDARDLVVARTIESLCGVDLYAVSLESEASFRSQRHALLSVTSRRFARDLQEAFPLVASYRQIIVDHVRLPSGWVPKIYKPAFFQKTLPSLKTMLDGSGGCVYLPFTAHFVVELVVALKTLEKAYKISFVGRSEEINENCLWKGVANAPRIAMERNLSKQGQYCHCEPDDIRKGFGETRVRHETVLDIVTRIPRRKYVQLIKLSPVKEGIHGGFVGLEQKKVTIEALPSEPPVIVARTPKSVERLSLPTNKPAKLQKAATIVARKPKSVAKVPRPHQITIIQSNGQNMKDPPAPRIIARKAKSRIIRSNVLLLGVSYPDVNAQLKAKEAELNARGMSLDKDIDATNIPNLCLRKILEEIDGRDLVRVQATEKKCRVNAYTISLQKGAQNRSDRHLNADFTGRRFIGEVQAAFPGIRFRQIILDYFWLPTGWVRQSLNHGFFQDTLPSLKDLLGFGGCIYLPCTSYVVAELVTYLEKLKRVYEISFVSKASNGLEEHCLWNGTQEIPTSLMQHSFGKRKDQEEVYCRCNPHDIAQECDQSRVLVGDVMDIASRIPEHDVRFLKLCPVETGRCGGFVGLLEAPPKRKLFALKGSPLDLRFYKCGEPPLRKSKRVRGESLVDVFFYCPRLAEASISSMGLFFFTSEKQMKKYCPPQSTLEPRSLEFAGKSNGVCVVGDNLADPPTCETKPGGEISHAHPNNKRRDESNESDEGRLTQEPYDSEETQKISWFSNLWKG